MDREANRSGVGLYAPRQVPRIPAAAMRVPLCDSRRQYLALAGEIQAAVRETLESGRYIMGREHDQFETEWAAYCQRRFAVLVANGTDALEIALRTIGCREGDDVVTAANAGGYTTAACRLLGVVPVYADIDPYLTISPQSVAEALGARTRAVVATHLYGKSPISTACRTALAGRDIPILEDCTRAHGAQYRGRRAGSLGDSPPSVSTRPKISAPGRRRRDCHQQADTPAASESPAVWLGREISGRPAGRA